MKKIVKIAAVQDAPVYLNTKASVEKACQLIKKAGAEGIQLLVFPEVFLSGYPDWVWLIPNSKGAELNPLYEMLIDNALDVPGPETAQLQKAARLAGLNVVIGCHERNTEHSAGSIYNSILFISDEGELLGKHRKLLPTGGERLVWAQGDGSTLKSYQTSAGKIGGLICWENLMPLARMAMYQLRIQILVSATWDKSPQWLTAMQFIAREGGMFVISCCMAMHMDDLPDSLDFKKLYPEGREWINTGNSCIVGPKGNFIAGPVEAKKQFITAEIDLSETITAKRMFDAAGHYSRPDVFQFSFKNSG